MPAEIATIETPELGDRSYAIFTGTGAVVVDPQRDIDRVLALLSEPGARLTHVLETHIHNDYVSGGPSSAGSPVPRWSFRRGSRWDTSAGRSRTASGSRSATLIVPWHGTPPGIPRPI